MAKLGDDVCTAVVVERVGAELVIHGGDRGIAGQWPLGMIADRVGCQSPSQVLTWTFISDADPAMKIKTTHSNLTDSDVTVVSQRVQGQCGRGFPS